MSALNSISLTNQAPPTPTALVPASGSSASSTLGTAFSTVLDTINPLQHIPIVSSIYRASQGTSISTVSQVAGDTLYGGLIGGALSSFVSSVANVAVKAATGSDITDHVIATAEAAVGASSTSAISTASTSPASTALVAAPAGTSAVAGSQQLIAQVASAVHTILHDGPHPERVAAQYQRAQTLDIGNKLLVKLG